MWQNWKFILPVSYCMMLNTQLESLNFVRSVQRDFRRNGKLEAFPWELVLYSLFLKRGQKLNVMFNLWNILID